MTTVRDAITSSLRKLSVIGAGETMTAEDAVDGLGCLNQMLDSWSADGSVIFNRVVESFPLSNGDALYTMGPTGDFNTSRPVSITDVTINLGSIVYQTNVYSQNAISTQGFPTLPGIPYDVYVNNDQPLVALKFYPVPLPNLIANIYSMKPLSQVTLNTTLDLPPGFLRAIIYNLAVEVAAEYQREPAKSVRDIAHASLGTIKRNNQQYNQAPSRIDPALDPRWTNDTDAWGFNIYGG